MPADIGPIRVCMVPKDIGRPGFDATEMTKKNRLLPK